MSITAGIDLGGTKIQVVVVRDGKVIGQARELTPRTTGDDVIKAIVTTVRSALEAAAVKPADLDGIGIGSPGSIDEKGAVHNAANVPGFEKSFPLGPRISKAFDGARVTVDNDVRVAITGEHLAGAGRPYRDLLGVFLGTGVGGGLVLDGSLRHGRGAAGEIGHTIVKDGGRVCGCGRRGCLEAYAGRGSIERRARELVDKGEKSAIFDLMEKRGRDRLSSGTIMLALEQKDPVATRLIDQACWALGIALTNAQNLLDLEAIIIGGGLGDRLGKPFIKRVAEAMKPRLFVPDHAPAMLPTELGDLSGAVGAALIAARSEGAST
jgi:glucokinase